MSAEEEGRAAETDGMVAPAAAPASGDSGVFSPGVLVRLQYAGYLFTAFIFCMMFKGGLGRVMSFHIIQEACTAAGDTIQIDSCQGNLLVYRTSFALVLFFVFMFLTVSDLTCCIEGKARAEFQGRFFSFKSAALSLLFFAVYWIPNSFFATYAWICMFASALFLVMQIILIVDFSYQWNEDWGERADSNGKWTWYLLIIAVLGYIAGLVFVILSYVYFVPHSDCNLHGFMVTAVIIMAVVYTIIAIWVPHGSIVPSGIVFAYTAFTVFSALRLSPDERCNKLYTPAGEENWKMMLLSAVVSAGALAYSVISAGGSRSGITGQSEEEIAQEDPDESGHLAGYCYFHGIMIMGSMYLAMLASNWSVSGGSSSAATTNEVALWVKVVSSWLTIAVYLWSLLAPYFCCKHRDYGIDTTGW